MTHMQKTTMRRRPLVVMLAGIILGAMMLVMVGGGHTSRADVPRLQAIVQAAMAQAPVDAAHVLGQQKCAECHKSEVSAWEASPHAQKSFAQLSAAKAPEFAAAMGVSGDLSKSFCADCHATQHASGVIQGVSCEKCHGASGPEQSANGWFSIHSYYGKGIEDRTKESKDRYDRRIATSRKTGMNRSSDVYEIAKNCLLCHTVPNEKLVNAGHPTSNRFEFVEWSQGEVRHNFQMDPPVNAESPTLWLDPHWNGPGRTSENRKKLMYVVGQLVDLEVSLRSRSTASDGDFATAAGRRISSARRKLNKLTQIPEVAAAVAAIENIDRKALRIFDEGTKELFGGAADKVAAATKQLEANHDGSELGDVDVPDSAMGEPFEP